MGDMKVHYRIKKAIGNSQGESKKAKIKRQNAKRNETSADSKKLIKETEA